MAKMMKCGHAANAERDGQPVCAICIGIRDGATEEAKEPDLAGRQSRCYSCKTVVKSSTDLPFFEHCPDKSFDNHYCGCRGWD